MANCCFDNPDVTDLLDLLFADPREEPDWEAIESRLMQTAGSLYRLAGDLLRAVHKIYEAGP